MGQNIPAKGAALTMEKRRFAMVVRRKFKMLVRGTQSVSALTGEEWWEYLEVLFVVAPYVNVFNVTKLSKRMYEGKAYEGKVFEVGMFDFRETYWTTSEGSALKCMLMNQVLSTQQSLADEARKCEVIACVPDFTEQEREHIRKQLLLEAL